MLSKSFSKVPEDILLSAKNHFIMKIASKKEVQQISSNHSSDSKCKDFMKLYKDYTKESFSFLVKYATLPSDNPLRIWKNLI